MRRALPILLILTTPAFGWEVSVRPVCTLAHDTGMARLTVTFDPRQPEPYAISVTLPGPWPDAADFSIRYDGPRALTIATDRQRLSEGGRTLTVTDRGFGNVLDGLEFNDTATALFGDAAIPFPLDGAAPKVRAFRDCAAAPTA